MRIEPTEIAGVATIEIDRFGDERGSFARLFDRDIMEAAGLPFDVVHVNYSTNPVSGTLRGMHFQDAPHRDAKIVRCLRGSVFDVALDIRPESPTRTRWFGTWLTEENGRALHIPAGCAHGFLSAEPDSELLYLMSERYYPDLARGFRWDDAAFGIKWPGSPEVVNDRDAAYPDYAPGDDQ